MARQYLSLVMGIFIIVFAFVILLINFLLKQAVIQPIRPMARLAQKISSDCFDQAEESDIKSLEKAAKNSDELGQLTRLFKQMVQAVSVREQSFAQQLQKLRAKSEQMKVSTESKDTEIAYLKALQQKAKPLETSQKELTNLVITDNHLLIHSY
jgi:nitrate/nitrite-specific signal transduction histidine kinase